MVAGRLACDKARLDIKKRLHCNAENYFDSENSCPDIENGCLDIDEAALFE